MTYEGRTGPALAERWNAPECLVMQTVTSTLDVIDEYGRAGAATGTIVLAEEQVRGRGRQGRVWRSPAGRGIWLGYLWRPDPGEGDGVGGGLLALRVGVAVVRTLRVLGIEAMLKWPNDVLIDGRKAAGILCETHSAGDAPAWVGIGVGINVHGPLPPDVAERAVALDEVLPTVTRLAVLDRLVPWLHALGARSFLDAEERAEYERYDWLAGRRVLEPVAGEVDGVDADGALRVRTAEGVQRVMGGSVVAT